MFKRILVLVLFLFGVFWWLSNRNDDQTPKNTDTEVVEENTSEGTESTETEVSDNEEESTEGEENASEEAEVPVESGKEEANTPAETTQTETAKTQSPVAPKTTYRPPVVPIPDVQTDVKVYVYEWNMDFSKKTIPSGTVNFQVENNGRFTHDFAIKGFGNLGKVTPGQSQTFTIKLRPGTYEAFSDRRQDYERGVKGSFTVTQ